MSSECSTRFARSESQRSVIRLEQLLALRLQVLRRRGRRRTTTTAAATEPLACRSR